MDNRPPKDRDPVWFYENIGIPIKRVFLRMEANGVKLDMEYLDREASIWGVKVMEALGRVAEIAGPDLNPGSPKQLLEAFAQLGVMLEGTDVTTLKKVIAGDPLLMEAGALAQAVLDHREATKIHKTYLVGLQHIQRDGIAHPSFNEDAAKTGRTSSSTAKE